MRQYVGIDAGGTWIKATLFSEDLKPLKTIQVESQAQAGVKSYFGNVVRAVQQLSATPAAVGLAMPGVLSPDGLYINLAVNIKGLETGTGGVALREVLDGGLGTAKVIAHNDAGCAALGEWASGLGKGDRLARLLHLTWGTGIGSGYVVRGESQYGWEGGHIPVAWDSVADIPCKCGSAIDLEAFIAVSHIVEKARRRYAEGGLKTTLTEADFSDPREATKKLNAAAAEGDELAAPILREALEWMARGLHAMAVTAQPTMVTIGGGMMSSEWLLNELKEKVTSEGRGLCTTTLSPHIVYRASLGNDAGMIGAAALAKSLMS